MQAVSYGPTELARTRFATSPLGHLVHGVHNSPCSHRSRLRQRWWATARRNVPASAVPLLELINTDPRVIPQFLLPMPPPSPGVFEPGLGEELQYLESSCRAHAAADLTALGSANALPRTARDLIGGSARAVSQLVDAVRDLFTACLAADWPDIRNQLHGDLTYRTQQMMTGGPAQALSTLHPTLTWQLDTLIFADSCAPAPRSTYDEGLTLMPCAFGRDSVHPTQAQRRRHALIYSARLHTITPDHADALPTLIGAGRARTLRALTTPASTTTLARRLTVTAPTASAHTTVLRNTGLITTQREGQRVCHELTPVGAALLSANSRPSNEASRTSRS